MSVYFGFISMACVVGIMFAAFFLAKKFGIGAVFGIIGVILALLFVGMFGVRSAVSVSRSVAIEEQEISRAQQLQQVQQFTVSRSWSSNSNANSDDWFDKLDDSVVTRDIYVSIPQLGTALAAKVAAACDQVGPGSPRRVIASDVDAELVSMVSRAVAPNDDNPLVTKPTTRPNDETQVFLNWESRTYYQPAWWTKQLMYGGIRAKIRGPKGSWSVTLNYHEKPWLATPAELPSGNYRVLTSNAPAVTRDEANQRLAVRLREEMTREGLRYAQAMAPSSPSLAALTDRVALAASQKAFNADQCVVCVDGPTGRLWYAAALVDARPQLLSRMAQEAAEVNYQTRANWATLALSLGGMLLALGVVYVGLNAITKGYFRGPLIAGTLLAAGLLMMAIMLFLG